MEKCTISATAQRLALAGDMDRAQAVVFLEHAADTAANELAAARLRWVRDFVLADDRRC